MGKAIVALTLTFLLAAYCSCNIGVDLSNRIRASAPPAQGSLGSFIHGIHPLAYSEQCTIQTSQIDSYKGIGRDHSAGGHNFHFKPFGDIVNLKFGLTYHKIHHQHKVNIPGFSYVKSTASIGTRSGFTVSFKTGYGMAVGTGVQLFSVKSVRKCRRRFFWKKCWNENIRVPRGVNQNELQVAIKGMEHILYHNIANKVSSGRLLRLESDEVSREGHPKYNIIQIIQGVEEKEFSDAISSLIGEPVSLTLSSFVGSQKKEYKSIDGVQHEINVQKMPKNKLTIEIKSNNLN